MSERLKQALKISQQIKGLRMGLGWTQSRLASEAKISAAALSKIEQGERIPTVVVLGKIASALKVKSHEITGSEPVKFSESEQFYRKYGLIEDLSEEDQEIVLGMAKRLREMTGQ